MSETLIIALLTMALSVGANIIQYLKAKGETRKLNTESSALLIETALKINKQEIETLRAVYEDISNRYLAQAKELEATNKKLEQANERIEELENTIKQLQSTHNRDITY